MTASINTGLIIQVIRKEPMTDEQKREEEYQERRRKDDDQARQYEHSNPPLKKDK
jgi:hypothetical protein